MNDTDIYADAYRAPDPPPDAATDTGSNDATPRVNARRPPMQDRGDTP